MACVAQSVSAGLFSITVCLRDLFSVGLSGTLILRVRDTLILSLALFSRLGASGSGGGEVPLQMRYLAASRFSASGALSSDSSVKDSLLRDDDEVGLGGPAWAEGEAEGAGGSRLPEYLESVEALLPLVR